MKTIDQIRYDNLVAQVARHGGLTETVRASTRRNAAWKLDRQTLDQIIKGVKTANGSTKNVGPDLARKIEEALDLEFGYMDNDHSIKDANKNEINLDDLQKIISLFWRATQDGRISILAAAESAERIGFHRGYVANDEG